MGQRKTIQILTITLTTCLVLIFTSCASPNAKKTPAAGTTAPPTQPVQSQVTDLYAKFSTMSNSLSQLQSQVKTIQTPTTSKPDPQISGQIESMTADIKKITAAIDTLSVKVNALQDGLKAAQTTIGTTSTSVNGLSVVFITNSVDIGMTGSTNPGTAQFAIKIINTTGSVLSNLDITGSISSSQSFSGMATGYPQLVDAAGLCTFALSNGGTNSIPFEAYSSSKTSITIPAGGSITIRPKISVLSVSNWQLPAMTFTVSINKIAYDLAATK